mmetsp:Transcript_41654/g.124516  ORF Transcript_41654/g.124516 Transcript_41654/m.124516 type:complete len:228 (-) Transcript_41654:269-952(-)
MLTLPYDHHAAFMRIRRSTHLGGLVRVQRALGCAVTRVACFELCQVAVVVGLHLEVEHGCLGRTGRRNKVLVQQLQDLTADVVEFLLHSGTVALHQLDAALVGLHLLTLLNALQDAPRRAAGADQVLVGDGQQVALLDRQLLLSSQRGQLLHLVDHVLVPLRLLRQLRGVQESVTFVRHLEVLVHRREPRGPRLDRSLKQGASFGLFSVVQVEIYRGLLARVCGVSR